MRGMLRQLRGLVERVQGFGEAYYFSRWVSLFASLLVAAVSDATLGFSVFSAAAVNDLGYTEDDMRYAASVGVSGRYIGSFATGLLGAVLGPRLCILLGVVFMASGTGSLSSFANDARDEPASVGAIAGAYLVSMMGYAFFTTTLTTVPMKNFPPTNWGAAGGLAKAVIGLSPSFLSVLYAMFHTADSREPDGEAAEEFLQTLVILGVIFGLITVAVINMVPANGVPFHFETSQNLSISLAPWFVHLGILVLLLFVLDACAAYGPAPGANTGAGLLLAMLLALALLPLYYGPILRKNYGGDLDFDALLFGQAAELNSLGLASKLERAQAKQARSRGRTLEGETKAAASAPALAPAGPQLSPKVESSIARFFEQNLFEDGSAAPPPAAQSPPEPSYAEDFALPANAAANPTRTPGFDVDDNYTGGVLDSLPLWVDKRACGRNGALRDNVYWLLFVIQVLGEGSAILIVRHMPPLLRAAREEEEASPARWLDTMVGLSVAVGGGFVGAYSDYLLQRGYPRTQALAGVLGVLSAFTFLAASAEPHIVQFCFVIAGLSYGAISALGTALVADLFGVAHYGTNIAFLQLATAVSSLTFATSTIRLGFPETDTSVDLAAEAEPTLFEGNQYAYCGGAHCFGPALGIAGIASLVAAVLAGHFVPNTETGKRRIIVPAAAHRAAHATLQHSARPLSGLEALKAGASAAAQRAAA